MTAGSVTTQPSARAHGGAGRLGASVRAVPLTFRLVFAVALCCGAGWALLTPPFQAPDETEHFAYVQYFAETGDLPGQAARPGYSQEQGEAMQGLRTRAVIGRQFIKAPVDPSDHALAPSERASRSDGGGPTSASQQPPVYYVVASVPYRLFAWADLPTRLLAIRLLSAVFFAATALTAAALAAELLPSLRPAPVVAGLAIALQPVMGFIGGGVSPDAMFAFVGALLLLLVVRGLRRPSPKAAAAIALTGSAAAVTKLNAVGLVPGTVLAVLVVVWRLHRNAGTAEARRAILSALVAGLALPLLYAVWTVAIGRGILPAGRSTPTLPAERVRPPSSPEELSYIWQLFLPRVPWQTDLFGFWPPADLWLRGLLGTYGWLDYTVPGWIFAVGKVVTVVMLGFAASALAQQWRHVYRRWVEIIVLGLFCIGMALVIGAAGYSYRRTTGFLFEQARYLFPLAGVGAVIAALSAMGLGRRAAPYVAAVLIGLFAALEISGVLLTYVRYYG
jgi:4-amino-4-deoxy-L-arabinose transferase-like glycosyltransferase